MSDLGYDAYAMLTRSVDASAPLTIVDLGAHHGVTVKRILEEFPRATVHAFEPVPDVYAVLREQVGGLKNVRTIQAAVGERVGHVSMHVTKNRWCSSVLAPSQVGKNLYGDWYDTMATVDVEITTLDAWAQRAGVRKIDILKIDVQGLEMPVLRGARRLLEAGVTGIVCEAQLVQEYEGASTFNEIDAFLRGAGYTLHQIHSLSHRGPEMQTSCLDGLWLHNEALARLRQNPVTVEESSARAGRVREVARGLARDLARGLARDLAGGKSQEAGARIAVFGAGKHTRRIARTLVDQGVNWVAVIDENPALAGTRVAERPVVSMAQAMAMDLDAVLLSSDTFEAQMWERTLPLRRAGIRVVPIYGEYADEPAVLAGAA